MDNIAFVNPRSVEEKILIEIPTAPGSSGDKRDIPVTIVYDKDGEAQQVKFSAKTTFRKEDLSFMASNFEQIIKKGAIGTLGK